MTGSARAGGYRRNAFVLSLAVGVVGVTFGVFAAEAGLSLAKAMAMSLFVFTGASQFASVSVIDGGGNPVSAVGSALLLAARNTLYGPVVAPTLRLRGWRRFPAAQFVIDETTAMATAEDDPDTGRRSFWFTAGWLFALWNAGTAVGVVAGNAVGDPAAWGLDAAFPAAFVALILPHLRRRAGRTAAALGGVIALVAIPLVPAGVPILLAAFAVIPALRVAEPLPAGEGEP
ncbi:MAG: AzlC family ABC transporter permease [Acidimicrobiales bacterium]|nr:AzlC family ABC transporter permease [Acidimicrobiales bacterium]